jgi:hypothetical protein
MTDQQPPARTLSPITPDMIGTWIDASAMRDLPARVIEVARAYGMAFADDDRRALQWHRASWLGAADAAAAPWSADRKRAFDALTDRAKAHLDSLAPAGCQFRWREVLDEDGDIGEEFALVAVA